MTIIATATVLLLHFFLLLLLVRIVVEMIASYSRQFRPPAWFGTVMEPVFRVTDPPLKLVRRLVPPVRLGNVMLDVAVLVLFVVVNLLAIAISTTLRLGI